MQKERLETHKLEWLPVKEAERNQAEQVEGDDNFGKCKSEKVPATQSAQNRT